MLRGDLGPAQSMADTPCLPAPERGTLTFGDYIQDHIERDEPTDHEQEGRCVLEGELGVPVSIVEEPNNQGHQAGLYPVNEEGWQVSEIIGNLTALKINKKKAMSRGQDSPGPCDLENVTQSLEVSQSFYED